MDVPLVEEKLSQLFKALGHPARLAILEQLRSGEQCVCHLEAHLNLRQAYISQQLAVLREAGLVEDERDGWNVYYRITRPEFFGLIDIARQIFGLAPAPEPTSSPREACPCPKCATSIE